MDLKERFRALWARLGAWGNSDKVFADLIRRYGEPHRHYHNVSHLEFGLAQFDRIADLSVHPDWVEFAFFFHDGVYVIGATDNEEQSTKLAIKVLRRARVSGAAQIHVGALIMATKPSQQRYQIPDVEIISDIDLAILGQPRPAFEEYERQVREEYVQVPEEVFWKARKEMIQGFLDQPTIFSTELFRELYEKQARENLAWTISVH